MSKPEKTPQEPGLNYKLSVARSIRASGRNGLKEKQPNGIEEYYKLFVSETLPENYTTDKAIYMLPIYASNFLDQHEPTQSKSAVNYYTFLPGNTADFPLQARIIHANIPHGVVYSERELARLLEELKESGLLKTIQAPWGIFAFYKAKFYKAKLVRHKRVAIELECCRRPCWAFASLR